jgi:hypothetical protein
MHGPVKRHATQRFWTAYHALPREVQRSADHAYSLLKQDVRHPSLHFKKFGRFWSVRIGLHYRALAVEHDDDLAWFWIGSHAEYDRLVGAR